jgi:hypothetical protein
MMVRGLWGLEYTIVIKKTIEYPNDNIQTIKISKEELTSLRDYINEIIE